MDASPLVSTRLEAVARAYLDHYSSQPSPDFHGLRDYYSLVKGLCLTLDVHPTQLRDAVCRNFSGQGEAAAQQVVARFVGEVLKGGCVQPGARGGLGQLPGVTKLIRDNLGDPSARHLLIICRGDEAGSVLGPHICAGRRELREVVGSPFGEDHTDEYRYRMLSRIILDMEHGHVLVIKNALVYGALYDVLNQNYAVR